MNIYQIIDWDIHYENSKSRERDACSFVCIPNKQHGLSFSKIMAQPDGAMIYGVWCLILGACSQQKKPRHGWLTHNGQQAGTAWAPQDLALKFRRPVKEVERSLNFISSPEIGWLKTHIFGSNGQEYPPSARQVPAECPSGIVKEEKEGIERIEYCVSFESFWTLYPRKIAKGNAYREWLKINPNLQLTQNIISALVAQTATWKDPKYIKHPERWIKARCWEDTVIVQSSLKPITSAEDALKFQ